MNVRWIACPLFVAATGTAWGQSPAVLGKDDAAFARGLYRAGYIDLAEKLVTAIEKSGKKGTDAEALGLKSLHLDLRLDLARNETDLAKRKEAIKSILQEKEEFVRQNRSTKDGEEVANSLPDIYRVLGETLTAMLQKETNIAEIAKLQGEGHEIYTRAEEALAQRIAQLDPRRDDPAFEAQYIAARYNLPRTLYFHALVYPEGEWKKKDLLEKAIIAFQEFGLDYGDRDLNYEGIIYQALCYKDLGKPEDAVSTLDEAIALGEAFEVDPANGTYKMPGVAADIVSSAVLQKVLLQTELKDYSGAVETAKKFFKTTPAPLESRQGLAVLAAQAEAQILASDPKGANETAQMLVQADDRGPWGAKGREIQSRLLNTGGASGTIGAADALKIAQSMWTRGDVVNALRITHQAIDSARGTKDEGAVAVDAYLFLGSMYAARGFNHEASVAFDTAAEKYSKAEKAPEALYQAMQAYLRLNAEEKRPYYKKRVEERMKALSSRYPSHPRAAGVQLVEGQQTESDGDFVKAAELYLKVTPGSPSFQEAQFRAGNAYFLQVRKLLGEGKGADAKQYVTQAETLLKKARADFDAALTSTMDLQAQGRLENLAFNARATLARLYLLDGVGRLPEVLPTLEDVETRFGNDEEKVAVTWGLRIEALNKQGKTDEATKLLDSLIKKDPDSPAIGAAAGLVARELDAQAIKAREKGNAKEADQKQRQAAAYYVRSAEAILKSGNLRPTQVEELAMRLFTLGLEFNEVPAGHETFAGWSKKKTKDSVWWERAANLFAEALKISPSQRSTMYLGRIHGFLGDWSKAADVYGSLFDVVPLFDRVQGTLDSKVRRDNPSLVDAFLEWGIALHNAGSEENDVDRLSLAKPIFDVLCKPGGLTPNSRSWWYAKYHQIKLLVDQGKYEDAEIVMRDVTRTTQTLGGDDPELKQSFNELKDGLSKKTFSTLPKTTNPASNPK